MTVGMIIQEAQSNLEVLVQQMSPGELLTLVDKDHIPQAIIMKILPPLTVEQDTWKDNRSRSREDEATWLDPNENPLLQFAGGVSLGNLSQDIDEAVYEL